MTEEELLSRIKALALGGVVQGSRQGKDRFFTDILELIARHPPGAAMPAGWEWVLRRTEVAPDPPAAEFAFVQEVAPWAGPRRVHVCQDEEHIEQK
jgi:hypothetical protein